jgi:hypothetical protein
MSNLTAVQQRLGVPATAHWDGMTLGAIRAYQSGGRGVYPMQATGHPDPATLANLGYYDPLALMDPAQADWVTGKDSKPGTYLRDLAGATNQVPQWAWLATGALLLGLGWWGWHQSKKKGT